MDAEDEATIKKMSAELMSLQALEEDVKFWKGRYEQTLERNRQLLERAVSAELKLQERTHDPIPMLLNCPVCHERHYDAPPYSTKPHSSHACQRCGTIWKPALVPTVGVRFLPGCKD